MPRERVRRIGTPLSGNADIDAHPAAARQPAKGCQLVGSDSGSSRETPWSKTESSAAFLRAVLVGASELKIEMPAERFFGFCDMCDELRPPARPAFGRRSGNEVWLVTLAGHRADFPIFSGRGQEIENLLTGS